jgi:hypothetical protein
VVFVVEEAGVGKEGIGVVLEEEKEEVEEEGELISIFVLSGL